MSNSYRKHGHGKFMWGEGCMYEASDLTAADSVKFASACFGKFQGSFLNNDMHGEGWMSVQGPSRLGRLVCNQTDRQ